MATTRECCGWTGWAAAAGMDEHGRRIAPAGTGILERSPAKEAPSATTLLESHITNRQVVADNTIACALSRPDGFHFEPGQYVEITLLSPPFADRLGSTRAMSIASAPGDDTLLLLMRIRDTAFKRSIAMLPIGAPVLVEGPVDDLRFRPDRGRHVVMIAGGVGVAPFRSALRHAAMTTGGLDATLFYSNRRPEDAAYLDEICNLEARVRGLRVVPTMTRLAESHRAWYGETERLSAAMVARYLGELRGPQYYVSGSTLFISGVCRELEGAGVSPGDIRIEMYPGY